MAQPARVRAPDFDETPIIYTLFYTQLIDEILRHLGDIKPRKQRDKLPTRWCRILTMKPGSAGWQVHLEYVG